MGSNPILSAILLRAARFAGQALQFVRSRMAERMRSEALAKEGRSVWYVYLIESEAFVGEHYIGITSDLRRRIAEHNAGKSSHTSKFLPWRI